MSDSPEQIRNRIDLWRSQILDPDRDETFTPLDLLLASFEADVRLDERQRIAQAIEAELERAHSGSTLRSGLAIAVRIVKQP